MLNLGGTKFCLRFFFMVSYIHSLGYTTCKQINSQQSYVKQNTGSQSRSNDKKSQNLIEDQALEFAMNCKGSKACFKKITYNNQPVLLKVSKIYEKYDDNVPLIRDWEGIQTLKGYPNTMETKICWETNDKLILGFEKLEMDIWDAIKKENFLDADKKFDISVQLANILIMLHYQGITHGDLKPKNVMCIDKNCKKIKLIDFGHVAKNSNFIALGTFHYNSPELLQGNYQILQEASADVWAYCIFILDLLDTEIVEFMSKYMKSYSKKRFFYTDAVYRELIKRVENYYQGSNNNAVQTLKRWLQKNPQIRFSMVQILEELKSIGPDLFKREIRSSASNENKNTELINARKKMSKRPLL